MSELSELLAGIDRIRLRQSRAIARIVDRHRGGLAESTARGEDAGYDFAVAVVAAAADRPVEEIEEMAGSILELGPAVARIMALAGVAPAGDAQPPDPVRGLGSLPSADSGASTAPSRPAAATRRNKSAR